MTAQLTPEEQARHITIWNRRERRKIAGNAAPLRRNLLRYLQDHTECEEYVGQDKNPSTTFSDEIDPETGENISVQNEHIPIWHTVDRRKVTGNAAPLRKNLVSYLKKNPNCEVYDGQDKHLDSAWHNSPLQPNSSIDALGLSHSPINIRPVSLRTSLNGNTTVSYQVHHQTHHSVRRSPDSDSINHPDWGPPPMSSSACITASNLVAPNGIHNMQVSQPTHFNDLSYNEMASSWSNTPDWMTTLPAMQNSVSNYGFPSAPSQPTNTHPTDIPMDATPAVQPKPVVQPASPTRSTPIPIPGVTARDRPEPMLASPAANAPVPMDDITPFFPNFSRGIDLEYDNIHLSPSLYFLESQPKQSPPLHGSPTMLRNPFIHAQAIDVRRD